jgi:hypothetical protein
MQIPKEQAEKLKRYFINADPFLWGILEAGNNPEATNKREANKRVRLEKLKRSGFLQNYSDGTSATYGKMNQDLLVELGIEGILERIVIPRVIDAFAPDFLIYFRRCWDQGQAPDIRYLIQHDLYQTHRAVEVELYPGGPVLHRRKGPAFLFVQIDTQHNFVERWTVFAGLWFEEIERLIPEPKEDDLLKYYKVPPTAF